MKFDTIQTWSAPSSTHPAAVDGIVADGGDGDDDWLKRRERRMIFDIQPNPEDWIVLGKKKGFYIADVSRFGALYSSTFALALRVKPIVIAIAIAILVASRGNAEYLSTGDRVELSPSTFLYHIALLASATVRSESNKISHCPKGFTDNTGPNDRTRNSARTDSSRLSPPPDSFSLPPPFHFIPLHLHFQHHYFC